MYITPEMGLTIWNLVTDLFDHEQLANDLAILNVHDHSTGKGVQIPTGGLKDGAVITSKVADESITTSKLADGAVTDSKIADATITGDKVNPATYLTVAGITAAANTGPADSAAIILRDTSATANRRQSRLISSSGVTYLQWLNDAANTAAAALSFPNTSTPVVSFPSGMARTNGFTALPGSPVDGQIIDFRPEPSVPLSGGVWQLRYWAGSASSHKWEFIGGSSMYDQVLTAEDANNSITFGDLPTAGPVLTLPVGGDFEVTIGAVITTNSAGAGGFMGLSINGSTVTLSTTPLVMAGATSSTAVIAATITNRISNLPSGAVLLAKYLGPTSAVFSQRFLIVKPIRVG